MLRHQPARSDAQRIDHQRPHWRRSQFDPQRPGCLRKLTLPSVLDHFERGFGDGQVFAYKHRRRLQLGAARVL